MGRIKILDTNTANGIAAGEVVERPSSVVKELVENSIDAGSTVISVEITDGGIRLIRVSDNGCGMDHDDAINAFVCHATSKLSELDDLYTLNTMGFRGEALSSIASVSRIQLTTREPGSEYSSDVVFEAGKLISSEKTSNPVGTSIEVRDLFYNLPARYKFLKKDHTEAQYITILCQRFVLIRPDISFRLIKNGKEIIHSPGNNDLKSALYCVYGKDIVNNCIPLEHTNDQIVVRGYAGKPSIARARRVEQTIFVNDRLIRSKIVSSAIDEAYRTLLMKGKYAFVILMIYVPSNLIDVNVHPQKSEVRFWNDSVIFRTVYHALHGALMSASLTSNYDFPAGKPTAFATDNHNISISESAEINGASLIEPIASFSRDSYYQDQIQSSASSYSGSYSVAENQSSVPQYTSNNTAERDCMLHELANSRYIGVVFSTYILMESSTSLIILDQHAAHEKILFEKLLKKRRESDEEPVASQDLISPIMITLSISDTIFVSDHSQHLKKIGFSFDVMGDREIALRSVPAFTDDENIVSVFLSVIESLTSESEMTDEKLLLSLSTAACKAAVKGHDRLLYPEIKGLIDDLVLLDNPFHCPHGRPIIVLFSQKELEKEFKRIL